MLLIMEKTSLDIHIFFLNKGIDYIHQDFVHMWLYILIDPCFIIVSHFLMKNKIFNCIII